MFWTKNKRIYMDYAAATPVRPEVEKVLRDFSAFGNPGTVHAEGVAAQRALDEARQKIADAIFCRAEEIIFTSGATESNNLALLGSIFAWRAKNPGKMPHIVTTNIEHPSVLEVCGHLEEKHLAEVTYLEVSIEGIVELKKLRESLKENTVIVSTIFASNEIGTIQPIKEISREIRYFKKHVLGNHESMYPLLHVDASQAPCYEDIDLRTLGVSLLTISSEKIYGPRGVAILYRKFGTPMEKILMGGSQEFDLRPGTQNLPGIVGFTKALELAISEREAESARVRDIQNYCFGEFERNFSGKYLVNGSRDKRLPNNINVTFLGFDSELLVIELDAKGIAVSEKSACNTEEGGESYVIEALRKTDTGSLRISFGHDSKKSDVDHLIQSLLEIFVKYEKISL